MKKDILMLNNRKSLVSDSSPTYSLGPLETQRSETIPKQLDKNRL